MVNELDSSVALSGQYRVFIQPDGPSPANPYLYVGCQSLGGFQHDLGTGEPIYCPSSEVPGDFDIVGTTKPPPSQPTTDFTQRMNRSLNDFLWDLRRRKCEFNLIVKGSECARPDNLDDFEAKIIGRRASLTAFNTGAFNGLDENAAIDLSGSYLLRDFDRFLPMNFGESADSSTFSEALNGIFADKIQCGSCGESSDGCQKMYVLTTTIAASPALASQIVHTHNGGGTWATDNVSSLGTAIANDLAQVGTRIVVVSQADLSHHHKQQSTIDAGTSGSWTAVSGGYVASHGPRAIWSKSPSETYIAAAGGYVYFMANPTASVSVLSDGSATTQPLNDIRGTGRTIVAVGDSNAVIVSNNAGRTWSLLTGPAIGVDLLTVEVVNASIWFVGAENGKSFYTVDGGSNWVEMTPDSAITAVHKIRMVNEIVGYMVAKLSGGVRVYRTADNGYSWHYDGSYVAGVPTADHFNFITPCPNNYNVALVGGLKTSPSTDGIIALGAG